MVLDLLRKVCSLLSIICSKFEIEVILLFWEKIMEEDNPLMIFYFSVALLLHHKQTLLDCESSHLPSIVSKISLSSEDEFKSVWQR